MTAMTRIPVSGPNLGRSPGRVAPVQARRSIADILPIVLLAYSTLLPQEVRITIADQQFFPWRVVCFILLPWVLSQAARGRFVYRPADLWMFAGAAWMVVSFIAVYGFGDGFIRGIALAFDVIMPYVIARLCIRDIADLRRLLVSFAPGVGVAAISMAIESITHVQFVKQTAASIFGRLSRYQGGVAVGAAQGFRDVRLGLLRASGPFNHPILAGLFLAGLLPLYWRAGIRGWPWYVGLVASLCAIFSVSSAAILVLVLAVALVGYDMLSRLMPVFSWRLLLLGSCIGLVFGQVASTSGLSSFLIRLTLNPATGYYRRLIWNFGTRSVEKHPWFGIGFNDFERLPWMVASIDNYWLMLAMRHGLVTAIALLAATLAAMFSLAKAARGSSEIDRRLLAATIITLFVLALAGFSVALFGAMSSWYFMLIGIGLSIRAPKGRNSVGTSTVQPGRVGPAV